MKKFIAIGLISLLFISGCSSSSTAIETVDAPTWLTQTQDANAQVIDVRTAEEFASGHLAGATNINVESGNFETELASLDKNATYSIYCRSGRRSQIAANKMAEAGFTKIINLNGGLVDLLNAGAQFE